MSENLYITTTLPYVNSRPHVGHLLDYVQADVHARAARLTLGEEHVYFNVGTDEHGKKIYDKATERGQTAKAFVDEAVKDFVDFCGMFDISYDFFYRTSEPYHLKPAQSFWEACEANGDIYTDTYDGLYCVGCEGYKTEKDLVDGRCPDHVNLDVIRFREQNYFFRLSKYGPMLLDFFEQHPDFIKPYTKLVEARSFIQQGLTDISISRIKENLPWGIDVPGNPEHVMYVWFDALTNYVGTVGYGVDPERFAQWWPVVQVCGPDNLRYQTIIWQAMLASAGVPFSKRVLVHGTILGPDGRKMSKTMGNVVSPFEQAEKFGGEAVRYYLLAGLPTYDDSAYREEDLITLYNANLADHYGNLLNRVIVLAERLGCDINRLDSVTADFKARVDAQVQTVFDHFHTYDLFEACSAINQLAVMGNRYAEEQKPWEKTVSVAAREEALNNLSYLLQRLNEVYSPIIPTSAHRAAEALARRKPVVLFPKHQHRTSSQR